MPDVEIYFSEDSELSEYEAISKEYRLDIFVRINGILYRVAAYTPLRLQQDFDTEIESYGVYYPDANLVLVKNTNKDEIIRTVNYLARKRYFLDLKGMNDVDITALVKVQ